MFLTLSCIDTNVLSEKALAYMLHYTMIHSTSTSASEVNSRVRGRERSERGRGLQLFVPHSKLGTNESTQKCHLKNDCLFFRVSGATVYTSNTPWLTITLPPA